MDSGVLNRAEVSELWTKDVSVAPQHNLREAPLPCFVFISNYQI